MDGKHYPILLTYTFSLNYYISIVYPSQHCVCIHSDCANRIIGCISVVEYTAICKHNIIHASQLTGTRRNLRP